MNTLRTLPAFNTSIGLDRLFDEFEKISTRNTTPNYPPYNILKLNSAEFMIELALAGFRDTDLNVTFEEDVLTVSGKMGEVEHEEKTEYLHRGIGTRSFSRSFVLSPDVKIGDVVFKDGILSIHLERIIPEHKKPRSIPINSSLELNSGPSKPELLLENTEEKATKKVA